MSIDFTIGELTTDDEALASIVCLSFVRRCSMPEAVLKTNQRQCSNKEGPRRGSGPSVRQKSDS